MSGGRWSAAHQRDGLRRQQAHPVEFAAVQQHLAEAHIVGSRRDGAAAARLPARGLRDVAHRRALAGRRIGLRLGNPRHALAGRGKAGIDHAERAGDALGKYLAQRLAGCHLDDAAEHVGRHAVFPGGARLEHQRQLAELRGEVGVGLVFVAQAGVAPQHLHRRVAEIGIGQARGVAHQILHGHCALRLLALDPDRHLGEFRQVVRHRRGDFEPPLLGQHHRRRPRRSAWSSRRCGRSRPASSAPRPRGRETRRSRQSRSARRVRSPARGPGSPCARHPAG